MAHEDPTRDIRSNPGLLYDKLYKEIWEHVLDSTNSNISSKNYVKEWQNDPITIEELRRYNGENILLCIYQEYYYFL